MVMYFHQYLDLLEFVFTSNHYHQVFCPVLKRNGVPGIKFNGGGVVMIVE